MIITRAYDAELEVREDQRQILGVAVPYGVQIRVGRYLETFRPGAFADHGPAPLTATHPRDAEGKDKGGGDGGHLASSGGVDHDLPFGGTGGNESFGRMLNRTSSRVPS